MPRPLEKPTDLPADGREIVSTRIFAAPREEVFAAFADPRRLAQWWGPLGFTNTIHQFDLRPGGVWHFTMHGPNGADYPTSPSSTRSYGRSGLSFNTWDPSTLSR